MQKTSQKKLVDSEGTEHIYIITQFPGEEGFELAQDILEIGGGAIAKLAGAFKLPKNADGEVELIDLDEASLMDLDLDGNAISAALTGLVKELRTKGGVTFLKRLLKGAIRDDKKFTTSDPKETNWTFNSVYQGNYGELMVIIAYIVEVNFKSFLSGSFGNLFSKLQEKLPTKSLTG